MTEIPADLVAYLAARDQDRADDVARTLAAMTEREQRLVGEAAVMGYVRGAHLNDPIPSDADIRAEVISACRLIPSLYPAMAELTKETRDA
jgi:hypothetical protein